MTDRIIVFQDDRVTITMNDLVVGGRRYRGKNGFNYRIDQECHKGFWQHISRWFVKPQHQQRLQDEHTLWLYANAIEDELAYDWHPVLRSTPQYLDELCKAMADANDIRIFYSGYGTNLPVHFGQMITAIRRRNITSLPVKPDDTLQKLISERNNLDWLTPINFDDT